MCILVVDDSASMRRLLIEDLSQFGLQACEADGSIAAIEQLRGSCNFRLVISDINMPGSDGLELIEAIQREFREQAPAIFVLSAERSVEAKERARELGVRAWVVKPYRREALVAAINKTIGAVA